MKTAKATNKVEGRTENVLGKDLRVGDVVVRGGFEWVIDATIDLTQICENAAWHLATAIDALVASGLSRQDAEAFAGFAFREHAKVGDGKPEDFIDDAQYERLTLAKG